MPFLRALMWGSATLLGWTHVGYPLVAAALARVRPRPVRAADVTPTVALVIAAWNEEDVIAAKLENALALDYPRERLRVVVTSDASSDRTDEIVRSFADRGVELVRAPRGGKVNAQNVAVRRLDAEVLAFSDANCLWPPDALRELVRAFADAEVAYACGRLRLERPSGTNQEGTYWRLELALRASESRLGSVTGGNGSIYAVRREFYEEVDPRFGHDLSLPYRMVRRGKRAVYMARAEATEKMSTDLEDEFRRKVRMFGHCWLLVLQGRMFSLRRMGPLYWLQMVSHRLLRYASGLLHVTLLGASVPVAARGDRAARVLLAAQGLLAAAVAGSVVTGGRVRPLAVAHYYALVSLATVLGLVDVVRGVEPVWDKAEGTR